MKDQLISYETAMLAKEKGFINGSKSYYNGNDTLETLSEEFHPNAVHTNNMMQRFRYEAPTQSLLQQWLRTEHQLHIEVLLSEDAPYTQVYYRIMKIGQYFTLSHDDNYFHEYEDALEEALIKALKII